jgi:hypothetical protein
MEGEPERGASTRSPLLFGEGRPMQVQWFGFPCPGSGTFDGYDQISRVCPLQLAIVTAGGWSGFLKRLSHLLRAGFPDTRSRQRRGISCAYTATLIGTEYKHVRGPSCAMELERLLR